HRLRQAWPRADGRLDAAVPGSSRRARMGAAGRSALARMAGKPVHAAPIRPARSGAVGSFRHLVLSRDIRARSTRRDRAGGGGWRDPLREGQLRRTGHCVRSPPSRARFQLGSVVCHARFGEGIGSHLDGLLALAERDWDLFVQAAAHLVRGWSAGESAAQAASLLRASLSPEIVPALVRDALPIDVTDHRQPALGEHLTRTIRTGVLCAYLPEADEPTHWVL